jgi:hypothetical protein
MGKMFSADSGALKKTSFVTRSPPSCATSPPRETGLKCDDAGRGNTKLSQPGDATAAGAKARIAGALEERYGNLI